MHAAPPISPLLSGLDRALELVEAQIAALDPAGTVAQGSIRGAPGGEESYRLDDLEVFAQRLKQIKRWLEQDRHLLTVVDDHISQQAHLVAQRQARQNRRLAVLTTVGGAIIGWLLSSAQTPLQVLHSIGH